VSVRAPGRARLATSARRGRAATRALSPEDRDEAGGWLGVGAGIGAGIGAGAGAGGVLLGVLHAISDSAAHQHAVLGDANTCIYLPEFEGVRSRNKYGADLNARQKLAPRRRVRQSPASPIRHGTLGGRSAASARPRATIPPGVPPGYPSGWPG
jgi:hypothetical protein